MTSMKVDWWTSNIQILGKIPKGFKQRMFMKAITSTSYRTNYMYLALKP